MIITLLFWAYTPQAAEASSQASSPAWVHGPLADASFFPIAVWLQSPANAARYREAGFNLYVGLWRGPIEDQLTELKKAGMRLICSQNAVGLRHLEDPTIIGWMHGDEPDNAQALSGGSGWGPPIPPEKIVADYQKVRAADPSRPILLNLGQGVAWDGYYGRGVRSNHPEDYPKYIEGCDIASFDIYPVVHERAEIAGKLWYVGRGVERLVQWTGGKKQVWNCLECTHISNPDRKATPQELRCEAWMSLIHGSRGLIYFVHQFKPSFREAALLDDPEMLAAATALNHQIAQLAPVLNSVSVQDSVTVQSEDANVPIATMVKRHEGQTYVFAVAMREGDTKATFTVKGAAGTRRIEVEGEKRTLETKEGCFTDHFTRWDAHIYKISR